MKLIESHIVPAGIKNIRLQEYGISIFASAPNKSSLKKAIKRGEIKLDGKIANTGDWINEGQKLELYREVKTVKPFNLKLEVLYEDDDLAVINKPSGYPTSGNYFKTIANALPFNLKTSQASTALAAPVPVHRLDNPTSGLLLIAKSGDAQRKLHIDFKEKKIQKGYHALVQGDFSGHKIFTNEIEGKVSETEAFAEKNFQYKENAVTLVKAYPATGRTHQIRIHLASNGHPILGDKLYGNSEQISEKSLFLAATSLKFSHPITKKAMEIVLPLPKKFLKVIGL